MEAKYRQTVYNLCFKIQKDSGMSGFGDYDYQPEYTDYIVGHFYSPKVAIEQIKFILNKLKERNDSLPPKFDKIYPVVIEFLDEPISLEFAQMEYDEIIEQMYEKEYAIRHRKIPFGKYKGKEVSEICKSDKSYIKWLTGNTSFKLNEYEESLL